MEGDQAADGMLWRGGRAYQTIGRAPGRRSTPAAATACALHLRTRLDGRKTSTSEGWRGSLVEGARGSAGEGRQAARSRRAAQAYQIAAEEEATGPISCLEVVEGWGAGAAKCARSPILESYHQRVSSCSPSLGRHRDPSRLSLGRDLRWHRPYNEPPSRRRPTLERPAARRHPEEAAQPDGQTPVEPDRVPDGGQSCPHAFRAGVRMVALVSRPRPVIGQTSADIRGLAGSPR